MNTKLILSLVLLVGGCKSDRAPSGPEKVPIKAVVAGIDLLEYREPSGAFQVLAPGSWKLRETSDLGPEASFHSLGTKKYPVSQTIHVSRYPNPVDKSPDPEKYYKGMALIESFKVVLPYGKRKLGGREVEGYAMELPQRKLHEKRVLYHARQDVAIIRTKDGFFRIDHTAPVEIYKETFPIFEAMVASFKPGPIPPPQH
jgi:hypothetical protein